MGRSTAKPRALRCPEPRSARQIHTRNISRMAWWNPKNRSLPTGGGCAAFATVGKLLSLSTSLFSSLGRRQQWRHLILRSCACLIWDNILEVVGEDPILQRAELHIRRASAPSLLALRGVKSTFLRCVEVSTLLYQSIYNSSLPFILILSWIVLISRGCGTKAFS